jgi:hypothetical protein
MFPAFGQQRLYVATGMEYGEQPNFLRSNGVEDTVGKAIEIQPSHVRKADRIEFRPTNKVTVVLKKIASELVPQTGLLVLIPVIGIPQVTAYEGVS